MALVKHLNVYWHISPNVENGRHYIYDKQAYLNFLNANYRVKSFDNDNYRINANVAKINGIVDDATYVIDYEYNDQTNTIVYFKCYYVESIDIQGGYTNLKLKIDLWGTYISDAYMTNPIITRCNRNIGVGIYDDITATNGALEHTEAWEQSGAEGWGGIKDTNVCIVFLLQYNVAQAVFGDDKISKTELYTIKLSELKEKAVARHADYDDYSSAEIAIDIIGGIYAVSANVGDNDAQVIRAWLCHYNYIDTGREWGIEHGITAKSKSIFTHGSDMTFNITKVYPSKDYKTITIDNIDINKVYYAGTFNNGLKLTRFTNNSLTYSTHYIVGDDDIKVIVQQGERQKDISSAYEVLLTTNSATQTGIRRVAKAFTQSLSAEKAMIGNFTSGTASFGGIGGGISQAGLGLLGTIAGMVNPYGIESAIGGGDGFTTFYQEQFRTYTKGLLLTPYILTKFTSIIDEKRKARYHGASFNESYNDQYAIQNLGKIKNDYDLIGQGTLTDTYICIETAITEIPLEASEYIRNKLRNGIYYN